MRPAASIVASFLLACVTMFAAGPTTSPVAASTVSGSRPATDIAPAAAAANSVVPAVTGTKRLAVVLINFSDNKAQPWTAVDARAVAFTNPDSTAAYFTENSWGQLTLTGDVFGWYTIPKPSSTCDTSGWWSAAYNAVLGSGARLENYHYEMFTIPQTAACNWGGMTEPSYTYPPTSWMNGALNSSLMAHELAHALGLRFHSDAYDCSEAGHRVALSTNPADCTSELMGDPFTVWGGEMHDLTNIERGRLGWLTAANSIIASTTGTYALKPVEIRNPTGILALGIPHDANSYLLLEFRQPYGRFDNFAPTDPAVNGVSIRLVPFATYLDPELLDATPETYSFWDAPLPVGRSFLDPGTGVMLTTQSVGASGASVRVDFNPVTIHGVPSTYHPISPVRLLDTRTGNGVVGGAPAKLSANYPMTFQVTGRGQVPANASAVTGNLTVAGSSSSWAVYIGPSPVLHPSSSTVNFTAGQTIANGLTVALSSDGNLSATYMSNPGNTTDLVFDVTGYYTPDASGQTYNPISPVRDLDTRSGNGLSGRIHANTPACFAVAGRNGVPLSAKAVSGNVTVTGSSAAWAVYVGPVSTSTPSTSAVNFTAGQVASNNLTAALNSSGQLCATYMGPTGATTDLVFDVTGFYTADTSGASFVPLTPARLLDTRSGNGLSGTFTAGTPRTFVVAGRGGVPSGAAGVTGNLTVVNEAASWAIYLGPAPLSAPTTSTLNFVRGDIKANGATVALSSGGTLSATYLGPTGATTDLVFDVTGYFVK